MRDVHQWGNAVEAGLWWLMAAVFLALAYSNRQHRRRALITALALVLFGLSDVVEIQTGAWWRPWWLLVGKGTCVAIFAQQLRGYARDRLPRDSPSHSSEPK